MIYKNPKVEPSLNTIRTEVFNQFERLLTTDVVPYDILKDDKIEQNFTLLLFPSENDLNLIYNEIENFKDVDRNQLYLPKNKLHITLIGEMSKEIETSKIIEVFKSIIPRYRIAFNIYGVATNKNTGSFIVYPTFPLHEMREEFRKNLNLKGTDYTIHLSVYEYIGWINFIRYLKKPEEKLFELMKGRRNIDYGEIKDFKLLLLMNSSRTLADGKYEIIEDLTYCLQK
jgi:hypothetical protein